jgi:hypothetical protein
MAQEEHDGPGRAQGARGAAAINGGRRSSLRKYNPLEIAHGEVHASGREERKTDIDPGDVPGGLDRAAEPMGRQTEEWAERRMRHIAKTYVTKATRTRSSRRAARSITVLTLRKVSVTRLRGLQEM